MPDLITLALTKRFLEVFFDVFCSLYLSRCSVYSLGQLQNIKEINGMPDPASLPPELFYKI